MANKKPPTGYGMTLMKLRSEYWSKRLDHTLTHTQTSSRLIYLIDAAVLALIYFTVQTLGPFRPVVGFASLPVFILVLLNSMHALLITAQKRWYNLIDVRLIDLLRATPAYQQEGSNETPHWWRSTHTIYTTMHVIIALVLTIMGILMVLYWWGFFSELPLLIKVRKGCQECSVENLGC